MFALLAFLFACGMLIAEIQTPLHGDHVFRQSNVAGNIEKYIEGPLLALPQGYNVDVPYRLFDLPVYQIVTAAFCQQFGTSAVASARAFNLLIFVLTTLVFFDLLGKIGVRRRASYYASAIFSLAPIHRFYSATPHPDPMVCLLALATLHGYFVWRQKRGGWSYLWMLIPAILGSAIKSPILLPVCLAIGCVHVNERGWRRGFEPAMVGFGAALLVTVAGYTVFAELVNDRSQSMDWYFSTVEGRTSLHPYQQLFRNLSKYLLNHLTLVLAIYALVRVIRTRHRPASLLLAAWGLCGLATVFLFFNVHWRHNYYQLPLVPALAALAGMGAVHFEAWLGRRRRWLGFVFVAGVTLVYSVRYTARLGEERYDVMRSAGERLQSVTPHDAFVVYLRPDSDWHSAPLYFAQRDGINCCWSDEPQSRMAEFYRLAGKRSLFVWIPANAPEAAAARWRGVSERAPFVSVQGELIACQP